VKLEIVLTDELAAARGRVITQAAKTGKIGDGKVFVSEVEQTHSHSDGRARGRSDLRRRRSRGMNDYLLSIVPRDH
jgi:hypothetical protein